MQDKRKKWLSFGIVLSVLIIAELVFDIGEIIAGQILLWTNPLRPKIGRLWVEDEKNQTGVQQLSELIEQTPEEKVLPQSFHNMDELTQVLALNHTIKLERNEFIDFYNDLPRKQSEHILSPFELISLTQNENWQTTQFQLSGDQLSIIFLDGYGSPIRDTYLSLHNENNDRQQELLADMPELQNRIISADIFLAAFNNLPVRYRQQVVNDAHRLASWLNGALQNVGISPTATTDGVSIYFQVQTDEGVRIYPMIASELGAGYLVNEINKMSEIKIEHAKRENE